MSRKSTRYLIWAEVTFLFCLTICVIVRPKGLSANDGISYYGIFRDTAVPYAAAFLSSAFLTAKAAALVSAASKPFQEINIVLRATPVLLMCILLTPYSVGTFFDLLHTAFGALLFFMQFVLSIWLAWRWCRNLVNILLLGLEFCSGVVSAVFVPSSSGLLLETQVVFQVTFIWILARCLTELFDQYKAPKESLLPSGSKQVL